MQAGITNPLSDTFRIYNPHKNIEENGEIASKTAVEKYVESKDKQYQHLKDKESQMEQ